MQRWAGLGVIADNLINQPRHGQAARAVIPRRPIPPTSPFRRHAPANFLFYAAPATPPVPSQKTCFLRRKVASRQENISSTISRSSFLASGALSAAMTTHH
jgi:hypothetical protein